MVCFCERMKQGWFGQLSLDGLYLCLGGYERWAVFAREVAHLMFFVLRTCITKLRLRTPVTERNIKEISFWNESTIAGIAAFWKCIFRKTHK